MSDFLIRTRRGTSSIVANSDKGARWLREKIDCVLPVHNIQSDLLEDFINMLKEAELTYEET